MKLTPFEKTFLASGGEEFDSEDVAVIDWRGEFDEIVDDFSRFLPEGYVTLEESEDGRSLAVLTKHATAVVPTVKDPPFGLDLAAAIAAILPPDYEACVISETLDSDTHCYLVRPAAWWTEFRKTHAKECRSIFAKGADLPNRFKVKSATGGGRRP